MPICIAGMHRSGTSMVARLLHLCGLYLGEERDLSPRAADNPEGFWENLKFLELNEDILNELGGGWDCPPADSDLLRDPNVLGNVVARAQILLQEFSEQESWGWKDPRNSLLLPFWREVVPGARVVVCVRNPLEVALSLRRRNFFSYALGLNLWTVYNERILRDTRPEERVVIHYEAFLSDPRGALRRLVGSLGLKASEETIERACSAVSSKLRHNRFTTGHLLSAGLAPEIYDLYHQLCGEAELRLDAPGAHVPGSSTSVSRQWVDGACPRVFFGAGDAVNGALNRPDPPVLRQAGRINRSAVELELLRRAEAQLRLDFMEREASVVQLEASLEAEKARAVVREEAISQSEVIIQEMQEERVKNQTLLSALEDEVEMLRPALAAREEVVQRAETQIRTLEGRVASLSLRLTELQRETGSLRRTLAVQTEQIRTLAEARERLGRRDRDLHTSIATVLASVVAALESEETTAPVQRESIEHAPQAARQAEYEQLVSRISDIAADVLPSNSTVAVVSRGDDALLQLKGCRGCHFPQADDGQYSGYYPADSGAAINHLEWLSARGADFLLFPKTAFWWLDHYLEFTRHLDTRYVRIWSNQDCVIYSLDYAEHVGNGSSAAQRVLTEEVAAEVSAEVIDGEQDDLVHTPGRYDVICFPIIDWDFRFQRPQQLLSQFARAGHRTVYLSTTFHQLGDKPICRTIAPNVCGVQLPGPAGLSLYRDLLDAGTVARLMDALDELRSWLGIKVALSVVDLPFWGPLALAARERWDWKVVYDCMDEHSGFSTNTSEMLRVEEELIAQSDLVLATSADLYAKTAPRAQRTLLLPNAADFEHFNRAVPAHPVGNLSRPIIGYYGAIAEWFDIEMIRAAARARPTWQFVLIGHTFGSRVSRLAQFRNVHLLGEKPYNELPAYLQDFDVACIPFLLTPLIQATNPVKFYEYLSAGKPVVTVDLPELVPYQDYCYVAPSADEFVEQVERALAEDSPARVEARVELARRNTWAERYKQLAATIPSLYGKAAIIIVSFRNLEKLQLCLESIWAKTAYPNFEVIVVDNGGQPEIIDYLLESAAHEPRLRVILNQTNLGFARANNIGIEATDADYVVLLNDDTVVTRGWLSKIVRYLNDPRVGLVGPVTNSIGNEAKVDVTYTDISEMDDFAEQYMRAHSERSFDIPMLAMFCLGMRRSLIDQIGLLDERFGVGMFEDDDFSLRARKAWYRVVCAEDIFVHHWGRASFGQLNQLEYDTIFAENRRKFEEKWRQEWVPHRYRSRVPIEPVALAR